MGIKCFYGFTPNGPQGETTAMCHARIISLKPLPETEMTERKQNDSFGKITKNCSPAVG